MKKFTLLILVMLLGITGVNAKSRTTTLWEGTDTGSDIEVAMSELVKGATLNLTFNWLGSDGAQFSCFWWNSSTSAWVKIKDWQWVNNGESYSFTLTDGEFDAITNDKLCFKTEVPEKMKFAKITQTETLEPTSTGENLLSENWASSKVTAKILSAVSDARIGDVLQFTVSTQNAWEWVQFKLTDKDGNVGQFTGEGSEPQGNNGDTSFTLEFIISNLNDLKKIKNDGFGVIQTGDNAFTMTAVNLLTYSDSYGYITIPISEVGYATWSSDKKYDFKSAGLQAYYASDVTTGSVTLTPMDITWDYQGYIIKGSEGEYDVLESLTTDGSYYPSPINYLKYNIDAAQVYDSEKNRYIFAMKTDDASSFGFYKLKANHTLGAHKAYLETPSDVTPPSGVGGARVALRFSDITDIQDIRAIEKKSEDNAFYNLSGQRIANPSKGIYIKNGKKYVVK